MNMLRTAGTAALAAVALSLPASPAGADSDVVDDRGSCSQDSTWAYRLSDEGGDDQFARVRFLVDSDKEDRAWTLRVYVDDDLMWDTDKNTGENGNALFVHKLVADDDAEIKVVAESGYGERCRRTLKLDE